MPISLFPEVEARTTGKFRQPTPPITSLEPYQIVDVLKGRSEIVYPSEIPSARYTQLSVSEIIAKFGIKEQNQSKSYLEYFKNLVKNFSPKGPSSLRRVVTSGGSMIR